MTRPRRRRYHLIAKAGDTTTLCNLPTYRRRFVLASDIIGADTCDACALTALQTQRSRRARTRGGAAGPMGGPGTGPVW